MPPAFDLSGLMLTGNGALLVWAVMQCVRLAAIIKGLERRIELLERE